VIGQSPERVDRAASERLAGETRVTSSRSADAGMLATLHGRLGNARMASLLQPQGLVREDHAGLLAPRGPDGAPGTPPRWLQLLYRGASANPRRSFDPTALEQEADAFAAVVESSGCAGCTPAATSTGLRSARTATGAGRPIPERPRTRLESVAGRSLADVRLHTDAPAAWSARRLGALAYAEGADIVFGKGAVVAGEEMPMTLLAHEVAHVLQQDEGVAVGPQLQPAPATVGDAQNGEDPCRVRVEALTNEGLLFQLNRARLYRVEHRRDDRDFFDYMNLLRRLNRERHVRITLGQIWLREPGLLHVPEVLYRISPTDALKVSVESIPPASVAGQTRAEGTVMTPSQFNRFLALHNVPVIDVAARLREQSAAAGPLEFNLPAEPRTTTLPMLQTWPFPTAPPPNQLGAPDMSDPFNLRTGTGPMSPFTSPLELAAPPLQTFSYTAVPSAEQILRELGQSPYMVSDLGPERIFRPIRHRSPGIPPLTGAGGPDFNLFQSDAAAPFPARLDSTTLFPGGSALTAGWLPLVPRSAADLSWGPGQREALYASVPPEDHARLDTLLEGVVRGERLRINIGGERPEEIGEIIINPGRPGMPLETIRSRLPDRIVIGSGAETASLPAGSVGEVRGTKLPNSIEWEQAAEQLDRMMGPGSRLEISIFGPAGELDEALRRRGYQTEVMGDVLVIASKPDASLLQRISPRLGRSGLAALMGAGLGLAGAAARSDSEHPPSYAGEALFNAGGAVTGDLAQEYLGRMVASSLAERGASAGAARVWGRLGGSAAGVGLGPAMVTAQMAFSDEVYTGAEYGAAATRSASSGAAGLLAEAGFYAFVGTEFGPVGTVVGFLVGAGAYYLFDVTVGEAIEEDMLVAAGEEGCAGQ
jgi:hypothetical protein